LQRAALSYSLQSRGHDMSLTDVIVELYKRKIDCGLESFQGVGLTAWVVNDRNRRVERTFDLEDADSIEEWLLSEAAGQCRTRATDHVKPLELLAELASSRRKRPKQVTQDEREQRRNAPIQNDGTHN
jgi:hypothetical protein